MDLHISSRIFRKVIRGYSKEGPVDSRDANMVGLIFPEESLISTGVSLLLKLPSIEGAGEPGEVTSMSTLRVRVSKLTELARFGSVRHGLTVSNEILLMEEFDTG